MTATPPTTNGDLHLGHLSGPYLAGDVFKRFAHLCGKRAAYVSSGDDNQTYVVTTAAIEQRAPETVANDYDHRIRRSLQGGRIALDAFNRPDARHAGFVGGFFTKLLNEGRLQVKETPCLFCEDCGVYVFEAYVGGTCPTCLEGTRGNICEVCGHPNDPVGLIEPRCTVDNGHRLVRKPAPGLFLPLESFRADFERYYARTDVVWRTHLMEFVRQMLAKPLPDFRLTYPTRWGIPVDIPGLGGQKYNAWGEMLPGLLNSFALAQEAGGESGAFAYNPPPPDTELVQFFGYDNSFFFAFVHLGLLFAAGPRCMLPKALISNEFYELENLKFSTSLKHAIWVGDFLERYNADTVRFYLSATNPELQRTNYVESEMRTWLQDKLLQPWERIRQAKPGNFDEAAARRRFQGYAARLETYYGVQFFSLRQAARVVVQALNWLARA
ncbi:class I tRNA ligase family protein, partial [Ramlibacter sp.]|uniref:class I tRNA ligase family protein n=1 Tax=Ramlibacter sp. TaxID=1917967 RepID=UPI0025E85A3C